MFNTTPHPTKNQYQTSRNAQSGDLINEFISAIKDLSGTETKILGRLAEIDNVTEVIYLAQETLGKVARVTREWANKIIALLVKYKLISKIYRPNKTCLYKLNPLFNDIWVRQALAQIIPAFRYTQLRLLFSRPPHDLQEQFTRKIYVSNNTSKYQIKKQVFNLIPNSQTHDTRARGDLMDSKVLNLTHAGRIALAAYPEEAINHADQHVMNMKEVPRRIWSYYIELCKNWCNRHHIKPNWRRMYQLLEENSIGKLAPKLEKVTFRSWKMPQVQQQEIESYESYDYEVAEYDNEMRPLRATYHPEGAPVTHPKTATEVVRSSVRQMINKISGSDNATKTPIRKAPISHIPRKAPRIMTLEELAAFEKSELGMLIAQCRSKLSK